MVFRKALKNLFAKKDSNTVQSSIESKEIKSKSSLEDFCDDNPDSLECRIYDV